VWHPASGTFRRMHWPSCIPLGDADAAFEWLNHAYAARDVHLMFLTVDVKWDRYRTDPRFGDLLARCGFTTNGTSAGKAIER
jgi:hypothetical protein